MTWHNREQRRRIDSSVIFIPGVGSVSVDGPCIPGETYDPGEDDDETEPFFILTFYPGWPRLKVKTLDDAKAVALDTVEARLLEVLDGVRRARGPKR